MNPLDRQFLRIRMVEEEIARRYPEQRIRTPVHLSLGQEAIAVAVCSAVAAGKPDKIFSTHRCHAHFLAAGGSLKALAAELYGLPDGCNSGRGGSMHLFDTNVGFMASMPIVGSSIPVACGAALASKLSGDGGIAVVFFGDAAVEEGVFHESLNIASVLNLPILFVCENNGYSINTPLKERQPDRPIVKLAEANNISAFNAEGNLERLAASVQISVDYIRVARRPMLICFETYRWAEHCGVNQRADRDGPEWVYPIGFGTDATDAEREEIQSEIDAAFA